MIHHRQMRALVLCVLLTTALGACSAREDREGDAGRMPAVDAGGDARVVDDPSGADSGQSDGAASDGAPAGDDGGAATPYTGPVCEGEDEQLLEDIDGTVVLEAGTCWRVDRRLSTTNAEFTIEPGVHLVFEAEGSIYIQGGRVRWQGAPGRGEIVMRGAQRERASWDGVNLGSLGTGTGDYTLAHIVISDAGRRSFDGNEDKRAGLTLSGDADVVMDHVTLRNHAPFGLSVVHNTVRVTIEDSRFEGNAVPAIMRAASAGGLMASNVVVDNDDDTVHIGRTAGTDGAWDIADRASELRPVLTFKVVDEVRLEAPLHIHSGATVLFAADAGLRVDDAGRLTAGGTEDAPIELVGTENVRNHWRGLYFASAGESHVLEHVTVANAGSSPWTGEADSRAGIYIGADDLELTVTHSLIRDNGSAGIRTFGNVAESSWRVTQTAFRGNERAVVVEAEVLHSVEPDVEVAGNDSDVIQVGRSDDLGPHVLTASRTWPAYAVPVLFEATVRIDAGTLTIEPGATLLFADGDGLRVNGGNLVVGGSGALTSLSRKSETDVWMGVRIDGSAGNAIENTLIEYGGAGTGSQDANLWVGSEATLALNNTRIENSNNHGLSVLDNDEGGGVVSGCANVTYSGNSGMDFIASGSNAGANVAAGCVP